MAKLSFSKESFVVVVLCIATAIASSAQTFGSLVSFDIGNGAIPQASLVQGTDGNFYGTTYYGQSYGGYTYGDGTVFRITPAGQLTTLYFFCVQSGCADGANPAAGLVQAGDGNFYGTTFFGGTQVCHAFCYNAGTVFTITSGGALTTLYSFCSQSGCADGTNPAAGLVHASDGNFYGTTYRGGLYSGCDSSGAGCGTVFKVTSGGTLTTLYSFCAQTNCTDGSYPLAGLVQGTDGNFYGTTATANNGDGTVFKITPGGTLTTLYSFCAQTNCTDGFYPQAGLIQASDGNFYGTTAYGGANNGNGTVFKITPGGTLTTLYSFCAQTNCTGGFYPKAGLIQGTDGNFYGTTANGGGNNYDGTVFKITPGGTLTTLYRFCAQTNCTDGSEPLAGLIQGTDGNFYGTTTNGGASAKCTYGCGTVFSLLVGPQVKFSPTLLSFGDQVINTTSAAKTVSLKNTGSATLDINAIVPSLYFSIPFTSCGATLPAGKSCKVSVTFTPTFVGKITGTLAFSDNAPNSPQSLALSGAGVLPATLTPASATYAKQMVGTTSTPKAFTLTNNQPFNLTSIAISTTGDFAVSATTCGTSLAARSKCTISVTFTPTQIGTRTGQLSVSDSASNSPQTANLKGTGT